MTRVAIFSDLHLGVGRMNRCSARADDLLRFFDELEKASDEVVVAGDLFDLSRPPKPLGWHSYLSDIRAEFPRVFARLENFRWIWGNHDRWMALNGVPERIDYTIDGFKLSILHGHQFDLGLKQIRPIETAANFVAGGGICLCLDGIADFMHNVPMAFENAVEGDDPLQTLGAQGAKRLVDEGDWNVVVMGHSHALRLVQLSPTSVFANTGSLTEGHRDWIAVDTRERTVVAMRDECEVARRRVP